MTAPTAVAVVIPARDEAELLPACLDAVAEAVAALTAVHPEILTRVFVVLDACRDGSAEVTARHAGVTTTTTQAGCVGIARAVGVDAAAEWAATLAPGSLWLANTDADSVVPRHWLLAQVRMAAEGRDLVVGTVRPEPDNLSAEALAAWWERHTPFDGHEHIHGANLGFSHQSYRAVGGFAPLPAHEDVELVGAMRGAGVTWIATGAIPVTTSGRRAGRVPHGFATYLDELGA